MSRVLVAHHTVEGQAGKVAARIAEALTADGLTVDLAEVDDAPAPDGYDGVVLGDSVHLHHSHELAHYLREHANALNARPSALFQVSMTSATHDEEHAGRARAMVHELLDTTGFDPDLVGMFAGALAYTQYGWAKKRVMQAIAKHEGEDTDTSRDHEYTDWSAVEHFAHDIGKLVEQGHVADT